MLLYIVANWLRITLTTCFPLLFELVALKCNTVPK